MALLDLVRTKGYKNFMSKLYGWGAAVVIIGALFKINHYTGADTMLIIGLGTESLIFFFSAFEPPHVDPDWSLVYPQLAGLEDAEGPDAGKTFGKKDTLTQELDKMLEKAKIGPELIASLSTGLTNLSETTSKLSNVADASLANDKYVTTMKSATESVNILNDSYRKTAQSLDQNVQASTEQLAHIKSTAKSAATLSTMFAEVSESLKEDVTANKAFSASIVNAASSANKFIEKYNESATLLSKTAETLSASSTGGTVYNKELQRISTNLSALNALYELHLQGSNQQMENTNKFNTVMNKFAVNLNESMANTEKFKTEVDNLTKNIVALNRVYGNMLSAMSVGGK
ncbi:MAG: gliding motility protein GldL [Bacteroidota bacterium]